MAKKSKTKNKGVQMNKILIEEAIRFCQMTKQQAKRVDPATLHRIVREAKKKWYKTT